MQSRGAARYNGICQELMKMMKDRIKTIWRLGMAVMCMGCATSGGVSNDMNNPGIPQVDARETASEAVTEPPAGESPAPSEQQDDSLTNDVTNIASETPEASPAMTSDAVNNETETVSETQTAKNIATNAVWFEPDVSSKWYEQTKKMADRTYLSAYFKSIGYQVPDNTYALIAPIDNAEGLRMQYYSLDDTAFEFSMTKTGEEKFWPASTVKLAAAVMALLKLNENGVTSQAFVTMDDIDGHYDGNVETLCREAIIPSNNIAYNRLMEIAGFDEINDHYLREVFHFPRMILQRRYQRQHPDDNLRVSPEIHYHEGGTDGVLPQRVSSGKKRPACPRESNCTTLAELAEVMFRVVLHEELVKNRRLSLKKSDIEMLRDALLKAPSCIGDGVASVMGPTALVFNKGGKVVGDDRLEIAVVSSKDGTERYLLALSMPYYEGVEKETNVLAGHLIEAMRAR